VSYLKLSAVTPSIDDVYYSNSLNLWGVQFRDFDNVNLDLNLGQSDLGSRNLYFDNTLNDISFWNTSGVVRGTSQWEVYRIGQASNAIVYGGPGEDNFHLEYANESSLAGGSQVLTIADFDLQDSIEVSIGNGYDNVALSESSDIVNRITRSYSSTDNFSTFVIPHGNQAAYSTVRLFGDVEVDRVEILRESWPTIYFRSANSN